MSYSEYLYRSLAKLEETTKNSIQDWPTDFPQTAFNFLSDLKTNDLADPSVLSEVLTPESWPTQHFRSGEFADLSFTIFRGTKFHLDLYIWKHQDTSIHDHHFCGAFKVIQGESYHISYDFRAEERIFPWLSRGELIVNEKTDLPTGSVKAIDFSQNFIHQNLHVTNPCVTLCLRTADHSDIKLNGYYNTGMKISYLPLSMDERKHLEVLMHLPGDKKRLSLLSDNALYQVLTSQTQLFARGPKDFFDQIHLEIESRNPEIYKWAKHAVDHQARLNLQLTSLFKA